MPLKDQFYGMREFGIGIRRLRHFLRAADPMIRAVLAARVCAGPVGLRAARCAHAAQAPHARRRRPRHARGHAPGRPARTVRGLQGRPVTPWPVVASRELPVNLESPRRLVGRTPPTGWSVVTEEAEARPVTVLSPAVYRAGCAPTSA